MSDDDLTYPGGLAAMLERYEGRRAPFEFGPGLLPPPDIDLDALARRSVLESATLADPDIAECAWTRKRRQIAAEFVGKSELAFLNAQLISILRKRSQPTHIPALFRRLWAEQATHLIAELNLRWLVSSVQTFADHGETQTQREVGQALRMLFGMMKLYEFERLFSGRTPDLAYPFGRKADAPLPLDMASYSLKSGGLDINLIAPVWQAARSDETIGPLADHLLDQLNRDPGGVFRRLKTMRDLRAERQGRK